MENVQMVKKQKKMLENPLVGSMVIPLLMVMVGSLIIFGVTRMLTVEKTHWELIQEMHSKTFGNRWVAAFELSKIIAAKRIPENEISEVLIELDQLYSTETDPRARDFIIVAAGALHHAKSVNVLEKGLSDTDPNVKFHAVAALGNLPLEIKFDTSKLLPLLDSDLGDLGVTHAAILAMGARKVLEAEDKIVEKLADKEISIRYAAATALVSYQNKRAIPLIKEILSLEIKPDQVALFNSDQTQNLKLNILKSLDLIVLPELRSDVELLSTEAKDIKVRAMAKDVLNQLNN